VPQRARYCWQGISESKKWIQGVGRRTLKAESCDINQHSDRQSQYPCQTYQRKLLKPNTRIQTPVNCTISDKLLSKVSSIWGIIGARARGPNPWLNVVNVAVNIVRVFQNRFQFCQMIRNAKILVMGEKSAPEGREDHLTVEGPRRDWTWTKTWRNDASQRPP
jgi:hypothetical protein